jgi:uncharacterized membrane protein YdbT with pleckstrin-like domain
MHKEETWSSQPSQILNVGVFLSSILVITFPLAFFRWKYLKSIKYSLQGDNLIVQKNFRGVEKNYFHINEVQQITIHQPVFFKLFSLNNLLITLKSGESIVFAGIKNASDLTKALNKVTVNNQELAY